LKNEKKAIEIYRKTVEIVPENIEAYLCLADIYSRKDEVTKEEEVLNDLKKIVDNPDWLKDISNKELEKRLQAKKDIYNALGRCLEKQGKLDIATLKYSKALELDPNDFETNLNIGIVKLNQKDWIGALKFFDKAINIDSTDIDANYFLGFTYLKLEKYNPAIIFFTKVIKSDSNYCNAYINRAFCYKELGDKDAAYNDAKLGTECKHKKGELKIK
jgi:tetratricopeptide (TPR) repeat protein